MCKVLKKCSQVSLSWERWFVMLMLLMLVLLVISGCITQTWKTVSPTVTNTHLSITETLASPTPPPNLTMPTPIPSYTPASADISGLVVFSSYFSAGNSELFVANLDTHKIEQITQMGNASSPVWSPDGERILFTVGNGQNFDLFIINADGSDLQRLTFFEGFDGMGDWSPDGKQIVFASEQDGNRELYSLKIRTGAVTRLTYSDTIEGEPAWSPNGELIAFASNQRGALFGIYIMRIDSLEVEQIIVDEFNNWRPTWCPDSTCLIYEKAPAQRGYIPKLFLVDLETKDTHLLLASTQISAADKHEWFVARSPIRNYINFSINKLRFVYDVESEQIYSLGIQAVDAALYP